jgi:hypothetical protein
MLFFHRVEFKELPKRDDPLYVGHFFPLKGMWFKKRVERQQMIYSVAIAWYRIASKQIKSPGMLSEEMFVTVLTSKDRAARQVIEHFFTITKLGFNYNDGTNHAPTVVSPKKLPDSYVYSIEKHLNDVVYHPGPAPTIESYVQSVVKVRQHRASYVLQRLKDDDRNDLLAATVYLLSKEEHTFYYRPSGKLQARDTSVWPIRSIETWPGWLRSELFGTTIDIENSFCQYIMSYLERAHIGREHILRLKYPDLLRAVYDKQNFREELCRDVLRLPIHDENISLVKRLVMALANGSNCTAGLMTSDSRSEAVRIVKQASPDLAPSEMIAAGERCHKIARQFRGAKRELCLILGMKPNRDNLKMVFHKYFEWEKEARYSIWKATGKTGLHLHDGIDGIVTNESAEDLEKRILVECGLKVKVDECIES